MITCPNRRHFNHHHYIIVLKPELSQYKIDNSLHSWNVQNGFSRSQENQQQITKKPVHLALALNIGAENTSQAGI